MLNCKPFLSIQDACSVTGLSQHFLRQGCKDGSVPCVKSGAKYMVNVPLLLKNLGVPSEVSAHDHKAH